MMKRFNEKVVVVTGGASGIGEATVRRFAAEGARVVFADNNEERGADVARSVADAGGVAVFVHANIEDENSAAGVITHAGERFGSVHVLVNNAGIRSYNSVLESTSESWDRVLGVNLKGYAFCAKAAIPHMQRGGSGAIVNVASIRSIVAGSRAVEYDTTKAAILGLTRSIARDHALDGIRANAVGPGPIYTLFHQQRAAKLGMTEAAYIDQFGSTTMLKRPGEPGEVANAILFLASDEASYITGTCLFVDGGGTAQE